MLTIRKSYSHHIHKEELLFFPLFPFIDGVLFLFSPSCPHFHRANHNYHHYYIIKKIHKGDKNEVFL